MNKSELDLITQLAGQVNRDLQGVPNRAPIDPHEFLRKAGVPVNKSQPTVAARSYPGMIEGMIEPPKSTPMGSEIIGKMEGGPDLIPIPDDLKKFVTEDVMPASPTPEYPPIPEYPPAAEPLSETPNIQHGDAPTPLDRLKDIQQRLDRLEQFVLKRDKYWSKSKNNKSKKKSSKAHENRPALLPGSSDPETATSGTPS